MGYRASGVKVSSMFLGNAAISIAAEISIKTSVAETEQ